MRIFLTGATGFIGRAAVLRLRRDGHELVAWVRSGEKARQLLGAEAELVEARGGEAALREALSRCEAVLHLAGEPVVGKRWREERKKALLESRAGLARQILRAMAELPSSKRPSVFISGSAVGYYGDRGDEVLTEECGPGTDFLSSLCSEWEASAREAEALGARVVMLRTGIVLGRDGGSLSSLLPAFKAGVGGPISNGRGWVPWIHLWDVAEIIARAVNDPSLRGAYNVAAPNPVQWRHFATALGRTLRRPAILPVPGFALKMLFGGGATAILASQRAVPKRLESEGFQFAFTDVEKALQDVLSAPVTIEKVKEAPQSAYLAKRRARYVLQSRAELSLPKADVFAFFCRPENLGLMTPSGMQFQIRQLPEQMGSGVRVEYRLKVGPVPLAWRTLIERWEPGESFVDVQEAGPYRAWWHEHRFVASGANATRMEDRVFFAAPFGVLGRLAQRLFVAPQLRKIFGYRAEAIRLRFGEAPPAYK